MRKRRTPHRTERGPFLIAKAAWSSMWKQGGGHIINVASTTALQAWTGASAYHASKFGLLGLGRALSVEGRNYGIRVTTILPGGMHTGFFCRFAEQGIPLPDPSTLQDPADVARTILFVVTTPPGSLIQEVSSHHPMSRAGQSTRRAIGYVSFRPPGQVQPASPRSPCL